MTELDHTILGIIARDGPLSAYDVRRVFALSTTPLWSSSQGSVYPAIKRLISVGWVNATSSGAPRGKQDLSITDEGNAALQAWLGNLSAWMGAVTADPIRTRAYFLPLVPTAERRRFVRDALRYTEEAIARTERALSAPSRGDNPDEHERLVDLGAIYALRAKKQWLERVAEALSMGREP